MLASMQGLARWPASANPAVRRQPPRAVTCAAAGAPKREVVVGIDLGTTNSAVAHIVAGGTPKCIPNADGEMVTPSVVSVQIGGEVVVGKAAKKQASLNPGNTFYSIKRLIGRRFEDAAVQGEIPRLAYQARDAPPTLPSSSAFKDACVCGTAGSRRWGNLL